MRQDGFRERDLAIRFLSGSLKQPQGTINLGKQGVVKVVPVMSVVACNIGPGVSVGLAMVKLEECILQANPGLAPGDFEVEPGWCKHLASGRPVDDEMVFITQEGCTLGPPPIAAPVTAPSPASV